MKITREKRPDRVICKWRDNYDQKLSNVVDDYCHNRVPWGEVIKVVDEILSHSVTIAVEKAKEEGREEAKKQHIKEVDMVKECIYGMKKINSIILNGEEVDLITKYQAVNCVNLMEHSHLTPIKSLKKKK